jgi:glycosyltransferase involved in cell wall biosynthesis
VRVPLGELAELPNVRLLGPRPYQRLPAYCAAFDVALLPFVLNELTEAVNPIKLREYLAAGVPTVTTALREIIPLADTPGLHVAVSAGDFVEAVGRRLTGRDERARRELAASMVPHSWSARCADMAREVERALGTAPRAAAPHGAPS